MKLAILISLAFTAATLSSCAGKKLMKDCEHKGSEIYECDDL